MKPNHLLVAGVLLFATLSCTKEKAGDALNPSTNTPNQTTGPRVTPARTGVLTGNVICPTKYTLTLYNHEFRSDAYSINPRTGDFVFSSLPMGTFNLLVQPAEIQYEKKLILNITVSGGVTDLGVIVIE